MRLVGAIILLASLTIGTVAAQGAPPDNQDFGIWTNPSKSVQVEVKPCDGKICGDVVWADEAAKAAAAGHGVPQLVGTNVLWAVSSKGESQWQGKVFVPVSNKTFTGKATKIDNNTVMLKGCLRKNIGCKSQTWTRVK